MQPVSKDVQNKCMSFSLRLELGIEKLNSRIVDESAMKINLWTQILASLGCDMADEGCIQAITTSEVRTVL